MLNSDLIGFHLFEYAKNFLTGCRKLMDLNYEFSRGGFLGVDFDDRLVMLRIGHMGIEKQYILEKLESQEFTKFYEPLQKRSLRSKFIIAGLDYMHPIYGILNKLKAYYQFLCDDPKKAKNVLMIQYAIPGVSGDSFKKNREEIYSLVKAIQERFGKVLVFKEGPVTPA